MAFQITFSILMAVFITFSFSSSSYASRTFEVGGKDGWTLNPSETYNDWSGRLRFLINDTLHFKYDGGSDSVLVVDKDDYEGCDLSSPVVKLDGGDSAFKLDRSGPFYFVSGNKSNCDRGQKVTVVVLALRNRLPPPAAATPPSPTATPPSPTATPPSPAATPPSSSASPPSPTVLPPAPTVSPAVPPSSSPAPPTLSPVSPAPAAESPGSPAPAAGAPGSTPPAAGGPGSPPEVPSGIPGLNPPGAAAPGGGSSGSPGGATGQSPGSNNPADVNSPPPPSPSATPPLSGGVTASLATMIFALWVIN